MAKGDWDQKLRNWFVGRRGPDDLCLFALYLAIALCVVNIFVNVQVISWISIALLVYSGWRMSSKNLYARSMENEKFLKLLGPARPWFQNPKAAFAEAKAYKHAKCPGCGQKVRVPRGKGKIRITCPKCHQKFEARS